MKHFYDTIPQTTQEAAESVNRAISQEERIYQFFSEECRPKGIYDPEWTAWNLKDHVFPEMEITSIRRALFNLAKQGKIQFAGWVKGPKGVRVGKYVVWSGKLF